MVKVLLSTNVRDEDNLLEWVVHHLNLGFNHILIFDHRSKIPVKNVLNKIPQKFITIERIEQEKIIKTELMKIGYLISLKKKYTWTIHLDADEFLVLNEDKNVSNFLKKYKIYDQVGVNWLLFGTGLHSVHPNGKTILETYTKSEEIVNKHIKSFLKVKTAKFQNCNNPHFYILKDMSKSVNLFKQTLDPIHTYHYDLRKKYTEVPAFVAHYWFQAYGTYFKRKVDRPTDDNGAYRDAISEEELHKQYNDVDNFFICDKYNEKNKKKMTNPIFTKNNIKK